MLSFCEHEQNGPDQLTQSQIPLNKVI